MPVRLREAQTVPESLHVPCGLIKIRYLNLRLVLYRPRLLIYSLRREGRAALQVEEQQVVDTCRQVADSSVQEISRSRFKN
jgi:hypothetical protein